MKATFMIWGLVLIGIIFLSGCAQQQVKYVCSDGRIVIDASLCSSNEESTPISSNSEETETSTPQIQENQPDEEECVSNWQCSQWSECGSNSIQTRTCNDENICESNLDKPSESQRCTYKWPEETPSEIATEWVKVLIRGSGTESVFDYLAQDAKAKYNSYDEWNDQLYNMKYAWNSQGLFFTFIEVKNEVIEGNTASVDVRYRASGIAQKTMTQKYEFIRENDEWKLKKYFELTLS